MNWFTTTLIVVICFLILTDLTKVFVEFCVLEVFQVLGDVTMDEGIRSKKSLILGMP